MFSTNHFIWLFVSLVLIVVGAVLCRKYNLSLTRLLTILCILCVMSEVVKVFYVLIREERVNDYGVFIKETDLPFHLCSMQIISALISRFTKNVKLRDFFVTFMIPTAFLGGLAALLIPTISCSFTNVRTYQYFLYHAGLIWFSVAAIYKAPQKLDFKAFFKVLCGLFCAVMFAIYFNGLTQCTNFLYVSEPPMEGLPILNMDNGWFVYFVSYMGVALLLITLFFLPFWIYYGVQNKKKKQIELRENIKV